MRCYRKSASFIHVATEIVANFVFKLFELSMFYLFKNFIFKILSIFVLHIYKVIMKIESLVNEILSTLKIKNLF